MKYTVTIGLVGMVTLLFLSTGIVNGITMGPSPTDAQKELAQAYVEIKCDPCDYNIDYGDTKAPAEKGGVDEGTVQLKCDPCDYDVDYGKTPSR